MKHRITYRYDERSPTHLGLSIWINGATVGVIVVCRDGPDESDVLHTIAKCLAANGAEEMEPWR